MLVAAKAYLGANKTASMEDRAQRQIFFPRKCLVLFDRAPGISTI